MFWMGKFVLVGDLAVVIHGAKFGAFVVGFGDAFPQPYFLKCVEKRLVRDRVRIRVKFRLGLKQG